MKVLGKVATITPKLKFSDLPIGSTFVWNENDPKVAIKVSLVPCDSAAVVGYVYLEDGSGYDVTRMDHYTVFPKEYVAREEG